MRTLLFLLAATMVAAFSGCPQPLPPTPTPTPVADAAPQSDVPAPACTIGFIADCHLSVVAVERTAAKIEVGSCLRGQAVGSCPAEPIACLVCESKQYSTATVACVARDLGANANAASLVDPSDAVSKAMADAARRFITICQVGYR